jgi:hypothetical protein
MRRPHDPHEVAAVIDKAHKVGISATQAVAVHYRISPNSASHLITRARARGANIPRLSRGPMPGAFRDLSEVAVIANAAHKAGQPISVALANHYRVTRRTGTRIATQARQAGHDIPYDYGTGERYVEVAVEKPAAVLTCVCGERFPLTIAALIAHTLTEHGRPPYRSERIPKAAA